MHFKFILQNFINLNSISAANLFRKVGIKEKVNFFLLKKRFSFLSDNLYYVNYLYLLTFFMP